MADRINLYISAALDLEDERDLLSRAVTEIPVGLGWRIVQTPRRQEPPDLEAVAGADIHLLLLGSDIRAPVGLEWLVARRNNRLPVLFLKSQVAHTPAAQEFIRTLAEVASWRPYNDGLDLKRQVLQLLGDHILANALHYILRPDELEKMHSWRNELARERKRSQPETRGGAGDSGVILSTERYLPSEGILIHPPVSPSKTED
jgi:hypothetical protein